MKIYTHQDLEVYKKAFSNALRIYELSGSFPKHETYGLTSQIRRSSTSVCANIAEAFRKRRYKRSFISSLAIAEGEACETQVWLEFCQNLNYITEKDFNILLFEYDNVIGKLVCMIHQPEKWNL